MTALQAAFQTARPAALPEVAAIFESARALADVTPESLWALFAAKTCPGWVVAQKALAAAEEALHHLQSDEHRPLGAIGAALDGPESSVAEDNHANALAAFALADERLRADPLVTEIYETARLALCPGAAPKSAPVSPAPAALSWGRRALKALRA